MKGMKTGGRKAGTPNKTSAALKDMILGALDDAGGRDYLSKQAKSNPAAFLSLIGRVLPTTLSAEGTGKGSLVYSWTDNPSEAIPDPSLASASHTSHGPNGEASMPTTPAGE